MIEGETEKKCRQVWDLSLLMRCPDSRGEIIHTSITMV